MASVIDQKEKLLERQNKQLAPIFAEWMHALLECSDEVQEVVRDMLEIMADPEADEDEKDMATGTFLEALFPITHNGTLGADLEELEQEHPNTETIDEMDSEEMAFGDRVKNLLIDKEMTQQDLADSINVGQPAISMMLNREARPQRRTVEKIADALGVSYDELWPS